MFGAQGLEADVTFVANTGVFAADMALIRGEAEKTYGSIGTASLKAASIQERYDRVLAKNAIESRQVRDATIRYRTEMESLAGQTARTTATINTEERSFGRMAKGAIAGSGALGSLRHAAVFASSAFLGGFGLAFALKTVITAAEDEQVALARLETSLHNAGLSWERYGGQIESAVARQERGSGFKKVDITDALAANVTRFGDVKRALEATAAAEDVARQKGISLADAQNLLQRASFGNARSARQLGIAFVASTSNLEKLRETTKHATADQVAQAKAADLAANRTALLAAIEAKYHGAAAKYLTTTAGKQELLNADLKDTEAIIGAALEPTFSHYLGTLDDWLGKAKNQQRIQHDVNTAVHDGAIAFHALKAIVGPVAADFRTLGKVTGGTKHEIELLSGALLLLGARSKLIKWGVLAGGIRSVGTGAGAAEGEVTGLRLGLARLAAIDPIVIPIVIATYRKTIADKLDKSNFLGSRSVDKFFANDLGGRGVLDSIFGKGFVDKEIGPTHTPPPTKPRKAAKKSQAPTATVESLDAAIAAARRSLTISTGAQAALLKSDIAKLVKQRNDLARKSTGEIPPPPTAGYKVSGVALLNQNLDEAQASGNQAEIKAAAEAKLKYDEGAAAFAKKRLASGKGSPGLYAQYQQVLADEASQRAAIASVDSSTTSTANKAQSAHAKAIATKRRTLENKVAQAELVAGKKPKKTSTSSPGSLPAPLPPSVTKAFDKVIAFDRAEAKDKSLTPQERAGYQSGALAEVKKKRAAIKTRDGQIASARKREISSLTQIPDDLKAAVLLAKTEEQKETALKRELAAVNRQIATLQKIGAGKKAIDKARLTAAGIQHQINTLAKTKAGSRGENEAAFLSDFHDIVSKYAPNAFPTGIPTSGKGSKLNPNEIPAGIGGRKAETHLYELVHETRTTNAHLRELVGKTKFPHTAHALTAAAAVGG